MRLLSVFFFCIIGLQIGVFAELSLSQCAVLRTATSLTTIAPELAQLAMRYYRVSSSSSSSSSSTDQHQRQKRFLFNENVLKDATVAKGSVFEQMVANAFKDVNFTKVALLIVHNNESMARIRQNVNGEAIIRAAMREIDYEKLGSDLWYAAETEFDLEYLISSIINITHLDLIHEQLLTTGNLPDWLIKNIHSDLNVQTVQRMFELLKNSTRKFITIMSSSERLDDYLFNIIQQKAVKPLGDIVQKVKNEKPTTLDQLIEIILDNVDKVVKEQIATTNKPISIKKTEKNSSKKEPSTTTVATLEDDDTYDDVALLLYQCSIAIDSIGKISRVMLKALEQLYCTSVWE